jgi:Family of unknown function (DUF5955)
MSGKKKGRLAQVNEGIQATTVTAEVLAVGHNAKATKTTYGGSDKAKLAQAVQQLHRALDALQLQAHARAMIEEDLKALRSGVQLKEPQANHIAQILQGIGGKLKMVGVVLKDALALREPITQIAHLLQIPLHLFGL